ncbi:mitochondrial ATPase expression-domain-containing protein [Bombardia bombarda]|uniref:Mitochondrial ATPase expression-domain-containing protein n=1 Tax=Bombardia bombarda TaxID=252184 RepID=A0AA40CGI8_9PEZI|nr:mitochondrial ATPase expression-domain-containing protein [Bombardia bombarda]
MLGHDELVFLDSLFVSNPPPRNSAEPLAIPDDTRPDTATASTPTPSEDESAGFEFKLARALGCPDLRFRYIRKLVMDGGRCVAEERDLFDAAIARMPATAFSELLRSLDPVTVLSKDFDPAGGINVSAGMAQHSPLGKALDDFGIRKIYNQLFRWLLAGAQLSIRLLGARTVWFMMADHGMEDSRDCPSYSEFLRAKFLQDDLYYQYDVARLRVRAVDFKGNKHNLIQSTGSLYSLRELGQRRILRAKHRFGYRKDYDLQPELLTRTMFKRKQIIKLYHMMRIKSGLAEERILCALMIPLARTGSMTDIEDMILRPFYHINVDRLRNGEINFGRSFRRDSPMYPTERFLETLIIAYCANAEIGTAMKVVDFVSRWYNVPISDRLWFRILEWAYVQSSHPAVTEWKLSMFPNKVLTGEAVQMVWDTMTSEPYNVQPGFDQYIILIKSLLGRNLLREALEETLMLEPYLKFLREEVEAAFYKHSIARELGFDTKGELMIAWQRARARHEAARYTFQRMFKTMLKRVKPTGHDDELAVRIIPQIIAAFRSVMPTMVKYSVSTGMVTINSVQQVHDVDWGAIGVTVKTTPITADIFPTYSERRDVIPLLKGLEGNWENEFVQRNRTERIKFRKLRFT